MRHYNAGVLVLDLDVLRAQGDEYNKTVASVAVAYSNDDQVGRCSLTVSKPELKARLVSALEPKV